MLQHTASHSALIMQPENINEIELITAGELAKKLRRSRYGVKKALQRLDVKPAQILAGISFYPEMSTTTCLEKAMRSPNLNSKP